jgi:hypothetical protein
MLEFLSSCRAHWTRRGLAFGKALGANACRSGVDARAQCIPARPGTDRRAQLVETSDGESAKGSINAAGVLDGDVELRTALFASRGDRIESGIDGEGTNEREAFQ